jgi:hypothetical protein
MEIKAKIKNKKSEYYNGGKLYEVVFLSHSTYTAGKLFTVLKIENPNTVGEVNFSSSELIFYIDGTKVNIKPSYN